MTTLPSTVFTPLPLSATLCGRTDGFAMTIVTLPGFARSVVLS
jgi:hypothetical protein